MRSRDACVGHVIVMCLQEMAGMLSDHQLWREDGEDGYIQVSEALEKLVITHTHIKPKHKHTISFFCLGFCFSVSTIKCSHLLIHPTQKM